MRQKELPKTRLRDKFILFFVLLAVVPILLLGGVALYLIDQSHRFDVANLEQQVVNQHIEEVNKFLSDTQGIIELRVAIDETQDIVLESQEFILAGLLEENSAFLEASFINRQGLETAKLNRQASALDLVNVSRLPYFQQASQGNNHVSQVHYTLDGPAITIAAPVRGNNDAVIHVIAAEVSLQPLVKSIERANFGTAGYVILLDLNGRLVAAGSDDSSPTAGLDLSRASRVDKLLQDVALDSLAPTDRYTSLLDQTPVVGAGKSIPGLGWMVLVEWPLADADALIQDIRQQAVLWTCLVILAVLLLSPIFANRLVKPIKKLQAASTAIEQGDFNQQVDIQSHDELAGLGMAFNKMASGLKRLQELKNEFVFVAAHELRTPVTAIRGYLSLILDDFKDGASAEIQKIIKTVQGSNDRLVQLVNDLLEIARSDAGKLQIHTAPISLTQAVSTVLSEIKPLAVEKNISLVYEPDENLPLALGDELRVKEILTNLVSNAIKYNRPGGQVKIYHTKKDQIVLTAVQDNGWGLSVDDQKKLFEKFFRSDAAEFKQIPGTGLGLFIVKELVEKMNGQVMVTSAKGQGSTFSFSLPRV